MKKNILAFLVIFLSLHAYSQRRLMYIQEENGKTRYRISNHHLVQTNLANGKIYKGKINLLNDTQFQLGNDTIHIDSVKKILRIKPFQIIGGNLLLGGGIPLCIVAYQAYDLSIPATSLGQSFLSLAYAFGIAVGVVMSTAGIVFLVPPVKKIDGKERKLIIKTFPKPQKRTAHK